MAIYEAPSSATTCIVTATSIKDPREHASATVTVTAVAEGGWPARIDKISNSLVGGIAIDTSGNVLVAGETGMNLVEGGNVGETDAFVRKYDPAGNELWTRQFGTSFKDNAAAVAADASGNVLVVGTTAGVLYGSYLGDTDAFVRKYDPAGNELWTRQFGTTKADEGVGVAVDSEGNIVVVVGGFEHNMLLRKYDPDGNEVWTRTTSQVRDTRAVAVDDMDNILIAGGVNKGYLRKYDASGVELWTHYFAPDPTSPVFYKRTWPYGLAVNAEGNAVVTGFTPTDPYGPSAGGQDVFVSMCDPDGNELWGHQFGTSESERGFSVAADSAGDFLIAWSGGASKYDEDGNQVWMQYMNGVPLGVAVGIADDVFVFGHALDYPDYYDYVEKLSP